jgi:aminoglycoside/choline kinase family phosphotransferase
VSNTPDHGSDSDREALAEWLLAHGFGLREARPLRGDVSPRHYQRLVAGDGRTAILALYPAEIRDQHAGFARSTEILAAAGVPVPRVLAADGARGWMLVEDLGEPTLADLEDRPWSELAAWFEDAAALAARIAALPALAASELNPPLDRELMAREMAQTRRFLLAAAPEAPATTTSTAGSGASRHLTLAPADALDAALDELCTRLAAEPPVPCHRDFMARNLMPQGPGRVAVLDHQGLRLGPPAYDLASLLNDTLFPTADLERRLVERYFPGPAGRLRYHRAAAQRTWKAAGTYAAFAHRGSDRYVRLIAPTVRRFLRHFGGTPEGRPLAVTLERAWAGALG